MKRRQEYMRLILVVFLGLWVLIIVYQWTRSEPQKRVPLTFAKGGETKQPNREETFALQLDLLEKRQQVEWKKPKDIFKTVRFFKATTTTTTLAPPPTTTLYIPTPEEIAAEHARQNLSQFRVLGFLNKGNREEVFLSREGELFIAHQGDLIQNQYLLKELSQGRVVLMDPGTNVEVTIVVE
ncbi:MAG TPA: hypothetical protein VGB26_04980 [Nitrospiria bacterium]